MTAPRNQCQPGNREDDLLMEFQRSVGATTDEQRDAFTAGVRAAQRRSGVLSSDARAALEEIAQLTNVGRGDIISLQDALHDIHKRATAALSPDTARGREVTDEMVQEACDTYSAVYADDNKDMGDAMRAALKSALALSSAHSRSEPCPYEDGTECLLELHSFGPCLCSLSSTDCK